MGRASIESVDQFFAYVHRRRRSMLVGGIAATVVGISGAAVVGRGPGLVWLALLAFLGIAFVAGSRIGSSPLRQAEALVSGPAVQMELSVWPYRAGRSLQKTNRVLVTLDAPGSTGRSPLGQVKPCGRRRVPAPRLAWPTCTER